MDLNNYHIQNELGRGGMATVYLANHKLLLNQVAIKVLNQEFVRNENIRKRFLAEARNMARMSHKNIIKVTDLIDEEDIVAFVMEYIAGETLKGYLEQKGKLNDNEIKTIFSQMLEAVTYVHNQNLVHRDLKPSNFMIDDEGKVKLMDFGIAKNTDATSAEYTQTSTGIQMGTPMYMSPEQITETKSVTIQSDIYSLGVVLWQMVTGKKPYDMKTMSNFQLQTRIVNEPLAMSNTIWDDLIQKATEKDIISRFNNCLELQRALDVTLKNRNTLAVNSTNLNIDDKTILDSIDKGEKSMEDIKEDLVTFSKKNKIMFFFDTKTFKKIPKWIWIIFFIMVLVFILYNKHYLYRISIKILHKLLYLFNRIF
jgi:serine/threonine protein kinase